MEPEECGSWPPPTRALANTGRIHPSSIIFWVMRLPNAFQERHPRGGVLANLFHPGGKALVRPATGGKALVRPATAGSHAMIAKRTRNITASAACGVCGGAVMVYVKYVPLLVYFF